MHLKFFMLTLLIYWGSLDVRAQTKQQGIPIQIGYRHKLYSRILNENTELWIYVPDKIKHGHDRFPVIYLLDGEQDFVNVVGTVRQLSENWSDILLPQMIIVGIKITNRDRDLTPTPFPEVIPQSGGGETFIRYLEKEVIPYVEAKYPTAPHRVLMGHSLGGLFTLNALFNHTALFDDFIAGDPSLWWNGGRYVDAQIAKLDTQKFNRKSLYLIAANDLPSGMDTSTVRSDTNEISLHTRGIFKLVKALERHAGNSLRWSWKYYSKENHPSVVIPSEFDGLRFAFDYYQLPPDYELPSFANPLYNRSFRSDSAIVAHYQQVSKKIGYRITPPIDFVSTLGNGLLAENQMDKAYKLFNLNIQNYPDDARTWKDMAAFFKAKGDRIQVKRFEQKALQIRRSKLRKS